jgi:hypothetical protein
MSQRIPEHPDRPVLQFAIEVNEHVAARYELRLREYGVGHQAMIGKHHAPAQAFVEHRGTVGGGVITRQRRFTAGLLVIAGENATGGGVRGICNIFGCCLRATCMEPVGCICRWES